MAAAKVKRKKLVSTARTEFPVPLNRVLTDLLDSDQVEPGDQWDFISAGAGNGLIIIRDRVTVQNFDDNGDPV